MKKFATMLLALLLTAALTVPAMATFTPSSENKDAPEIISATFEDGTDAKGYLIVTPYSKKDSADPSIKESLERAYEDVKNASTLDKLNSDVNICILACYSLIVIVYSNGHYFFGMFLSYHILVEHLFYHMRCRNIF